MARDLIRILHTFFWPALRTHHHPRWQPAADIYQTPTGWLVKFELAGVRAEDIDLEILGSRLTVRGTRHDCFSHECRRCFRLEIAYSHFERSVELPCDLEHAQITTDYRDGMLRVAIQTEVDP